MKALIIVTVLAMATSAIAVPLSRQAKVLALLAAMQDNAEMEGWLGDIGQAVAKYGPSVLKTGLALGIAALWDEELDRESAVVQEDAEIQVSLSDIKDAVAKYAPNQQNLINNFNDLDALDKRDLLNSLEKSYLKI